jgi:hypothetical protein
VKPAAAPAASKLAAKKPSQSPSAAAAVAAAGRGGVSGDPGSKPDPLLQRIETSRSLRELQATFERQQQRLRAHHLAAIVTRLPVTSEGRRAVEELAAVAAAAAAAGDAAAVPGVAAVAVGGCCGGGGVSAGTSTLLGFAGDLVTMVQLQLSQLNSSRLAALAQVRF